MMSIRTISVTMVIVGALVVRPAAADPRQAQAAFQRALYLMEDERWNEAAGQLEESLRQHSTQVAMFNLAVCLRELHRVRDAIAQLDELLVRFDTQIQEERRIEVERMRSELQATPASLQIQVNHPDAELSIDGRPVGGDTTTLAAGAHTIAARVVGAPEVQRRIDVAPGETMRVHLEVVVPDAPVAVGHPGEERPTIARSAAAEAPSRRGPAPIWFWSAAGLAALAGMTTAALAIFVVIDDAAYESDAKRTREAQLSGQRLVLYTDVALGVAVGGAVIATILYLGTDFGSPDRQVSTVALDVGPGSVVLRGRF